MNYLDNNKKQEKLLFQADVLRHVSDAVITVDMHFCINSWNPAAETIYGWKEKQVLEKKLTDILTTKYRQDDEATARMLLELEGEWQGEVVQYHKNGTPVVILSSVTWIKDARGQRVGVVAVNRDITRHKTAEKALREGEKRFERIVRATIDAIWDWNLRDDTVWWSDGISSLFGYNKQEITLDSTWWLERLHPDDRTRIIDSLNKLMEGNDTQWKGEYRFQKADGTYAWVADKGFVERDASGLAVRMTGGMSDITQRKQTEEALQKSEELFHKAFQLNPAGQMIVRVSDNRVLDVNQTVAQGVGFTREEIIGQNPVALGIVSPELIQRRQKALAQGRQLRNFEHSFRTINGDLGYALSSIEPLELGGEPCILIIGINITERKQAEAQLQYQASLLRNASDAIIGIDLDTHINSWNPAAERVYGWSAEEAIGRKASEILRTEFASGALNNTLAQLDQQDVIRGEITQYHRDGNPLIILSSVTWVYDTNNQRTGWVAVNRDISKRKKAVQELQASEARFRALIKASAQIVWTTDANGEVVEDSASWQKFTGQTHEQRKGRGWLEAIHPEDQSRVANEWQTAVANETKFNTVYRLRNTNGKWRWTLARAVPLRHDTIYGWVGMNIDITKRKLAEHALIENEARLVQLTESLPQLVWTCQPDGTCDYLSKQWIEYTGIAEKEQLEYGWLEQVHSDDRDATITAWNYAVENNTDFRVEFRIRRHDGVYRWFDTLAARLYDANGHLIKWFGSSTDIEDKKQTAMENLRVNSELDKFVYSASHDLRSPLVGIMGLISLAQDEEGKSKAIADYLDMMQSSIKKLDAILQNILDYSYNARFDVTNDVVDVNTLLEETRAMLDPLAGLDRVELSIEVHQQRTLVSDRFRLKTILYNLLKNAVQFQAPHRKSHFIHVTITVADTLQIAIQDNGLGIKQALLSKIFHMYYRASEQSQGGGLGLYITKEVVAKLKGEITVESEFGKGSTFKVNLPLLNDNTAENTVNFS